jgi:hypothetical protein
MVNFARFYILAIGSAALALSTAAGAGEVKGPPPTGNHTGEPIDVHGNSICAFSGLNDTPEGEPEEGDPGGLTQSFGSFLASRGFDVSSLDPREDFRSPGYACNPTRGPSLRGNVERR